jgi:hypothetical protein
VIIIEDHVFSGCKNLREVIFEENSELRDIREWVFDGCISLKNIELPDTINYMREGLFSTSGIESIPENLPYITSSMFSFCDKLKNAIIPDKVTTIGSLAFANCKNLESVIFHNNLTSIGNAAFQFDLFPSKIVSITIPVSVTQIGRNAFSYWTENQTIYIEGRTSIPETWASDWCGNKVNVVFLG